MIMRILYTIGIWFYTVGIRAAALFGHEKAKLMVKGWEESKKLTVDGETWVWFHAASLGEFEQARPVLEEYRRRHAGHKVLVTFFSPSGYEVRKNYAGADKVMYLPMDLPGNVKRLVNTVQPEMVFFVKYEFWYNYLYELKKRGISTYIFSTIFRPNQYFFKWYGGWFRRQLKECFAHFFVQNKESIELLKSIGINHCSLAGDTRFDRVHQIALAAESNEVSETFLNGFEGKVLVAGSTWPPDEALLHKLKVESLKLKVILAPHVINEEHLKQIEELFPDSVRYSSVASSTSTASMNSKVLIIDNIGLLSKLYRYADIAYIGGGFGVGIHNILEAVTFGKPVFFGPNYHKFQEACDIIARGGGWSVMNEELRLENEESRMDKMLERLITDSEAYRKASDACLAYMQENLGSTEKILSKIEN